MNPKKLKQLKKQLKANRSISNTNHYIDRLERYREQFTDYSSVVFLINQVLESNRLIEQNLLPQQLPTLELPNDIQDQIFNQLKITYPIGDSVGDRLWADLTESLPKLDRLLRSYRDYLEATYGMWAYVSAPFISDLATYLASRPTLEIMAGNGYISHGLKLKNQPVLATDSLDWVTENETGRHLVTDVEKLDALTAIDKYGDQVDFVIMSWSPDGLPIDVQVLESLRQLEHQPTLICIGERNGATNSKRFWQIAEIIDPEATAQLNRHHQSFDLIQEQVYLIK
jgi:hypothetical protein